MSERIVIPSDDAIERGLASRSPRRPDASLLDAVMTGVHTTAQVSRRGATLRDPIAGRRRPFVWAALAAVLIVGGALVFSTGSFAPAVVTPTPPAPHATQPAAVVAPSTLPEPSATASALTCATQTTSVLTGDAMPPANAVPMTIPAGVLKVGVYMTAPSVGPRLAQNDVWAITAGTATRIASIVGPDYNQASVDDISVDGRTALIGIGVIHIGSTGPECSDLYAVRTDGSGVRRLTFNGPDAHASGGTFSHDGRYVAFESIEPKAASPAIGLVGMQGDAGESDIPCDVSAIDLHLAWLRTDDRLAAVCGANVMVVDVGGSPPGVVGATDVYAIPTGGSVPVGVGWRDPSRILIVTLNGGGGTHSNGPFSLTTLTLGGGGTARDGTWSPLIAAHPWLGDGGLPAGMIDIAPDGHAFTLLGDTAEDDPQGNTFGLYTMDATSGVAQPVAGGGGDPAWSSDSRSLLFTDYVDGKTALMVYDLAAKTSQRYGSVPLELRRGIWRAP